MVVFFNRTFDNFAAFSYDPLPVNDSFGKKIYGGVKMAECPVCAAEFSMPAAAEEGEIITCEDCGCELEVTGPDSVTEAPQEEEDWGQ